MKGKKEGKESMRNINTIVQQMHSDEKRTKGGLLCDLFLLMFSVGIHAVYFDDGWALRQVSGYDHL
jgi:hypothetical protein